MMKREELSHVGAGFDLLAFREKKERLANHTAGVVTVLERRMVKDLLIQLQGL
jgi:hypothetical protein